MVKKYLQIIVCLMLVSLTTNMVPYFNKETETIASATSIDLVKGDIVFVDLQEWVVNNDLAIPLEGYANDHVAIYAGKIAGIEYFWESAPYFPNINLWNGVQKTSKAIFKLLYKNYQVAKIPGADSSERNDMITFCKNQRGENYQWSYPNDSRYETCFVNPDVFENPKPYPYLPGSVYWKYEDALWNEYSYKWHCSELVWAAWLHGAGIDLDPTPYKQQGWDYGYADEGDTWSYIIHINELKEGCENLGTLYDIDL
jgi:hypothetical protein